MREAVNEFVTFMQQYDLTTADYSKIFDEHSTTIQYNISTNVSEKIMEIYRENPKSIIITGNAGDGKTRICRNVYEDLVGKFEGWPESGIVEIQHNGKRIRIIKDLSELRDEVIHTELSLLKDSLENKELNLYFLIAANEGKLTHFITRDTKYRKLEDLIIPQFSPEHPKDENLQVYNLLHTSSSIYSKKIVDEWNKDENWDICNQCSSKHKCVINYNREKLSRKQVAIRLNRIYRSLDGNQGHMTMRELLIHLAYVYTGGLHCRDIHSADTKALQQQSAKVYYENFFAHNTAKEVFEEILGIHEMRAFDPGHISDSKIDDFIMNGDLEAAPASEQHEDLYGITLDTEYGYYGQELQEYRLNYRSDEDRGRQLADKWLPRLRRKFYFESNENRTIENIVPYRYRKLFLDVLKLKENEKVSLDLCVQIIAGLNVYFSKKMVYSPSNNLYVTSENLYVYKEINYSDISFHIPKDDIKLDQKNSYFILKVGKDNLVINLITFEYLLRLANGGLFHVLKEDVEILLNNFRNKLITKSDTSDSVFKILKFEDQYGAYTLKNIQVQTNSNDDNDDEEDFD